MSASLVIGLPLHPANVVFAVIGRTRNGWLRCQIYSDQAGKRLTLGETVFKFRVCDVAPFTSPHQPH